MGKRLYSLFAGAIVLCSGSRCVMLRGIENFPSSSGMNKIVFSSEHLPEHLDARQRFMLWRDMWNAQFGAAEMRQTSDRPFFAMSEFAPAGSALAFRFKAVVERWTGDPRRLPGERRDDFVLLFNGCSETVSVRYGVREFDLLPGRAALHNLGLPAETRNGSHFHMIAAAAPRADILALVPRADEFVSRLLDQANPALRHLQRYIELLLSDDSVASSPVLAARTGTMLVDLMALALGACGDAAELASARGLRAARLHDILEVIRKEFADPAFATEIVMRRVNLSRRYINELLQESGGSLAERVLELRLQKARAMLADARHDRLKVSDIAFACGFNEVSYFNRRFRARFGCSPTQCRGGHCAV